jgi:hypothetical protein
MSDTKEKGQKENNNSSTFQLSSRVRGLFFGTQSKFQKWWATKHGKIITIAAGAVAVFYFALGIIDFINGFYELCENQGWDWCQEKENSSETDDESKDIVIPSLPPETIAQLAHRLFDNNNAELQIKILPSILNVGESMYMHFKTNSDGYLLVLNINSQGALSQLIPRISQEKPSYLKLNKDQERIIPDPDDPYDLPRFIIEEPTGQEILIAILVKENELPLGIINALPFTHNLQIEPAKKQLNNLHDELDKSAPAKWMGLVFEYETN